MSRMLDGLTLADSARILTTLASFVLVEADDPQRALDHFVDTLRRQVESATRREPRMIERAQRPAAHDVTTADVDATAVDGAETAADGADTAEIARGV
jgi:hypothetical protein